jgi:hypothetical protein
MAFGSGGYTVRDVLLSGMGESRDHESRNRENQYTTRIGRDP